MNKEEKFVITISRQFGTGGHEIGAELARRLGVKLLDKQILNAVAGRISAVEDAVDKIESRNPLWRDDFTNFYQNYMANAEYNGQEHDQTSRELYTKTCTGRDWSDATNYDICLDVRRFGVNGAVDFLMNCIE